MNNEVLKYLNLGFSVIPLGKISLKNDGSKDITYPISWAKYQTQRASVQEVSSWKWTNLGVVTGKISNLIILDTDLYKQGYDEQLFKSLNIPLTPVQQTARGGRQYFFKHPGFEIRNSVSIGHSGSGIDIRADGGMSIIPPTKTTYGEYKWLVSPDDADFAELPKTLLEILKKQVTTTSSKKLSNYDMLGIGEGERNSTLLSLVGSLILKYPRNKWEKEVLPLVIAMNQSFKPPLDNKEVLSIYNSITKKELSKGEPTPQQQEVKEVKIDQTGALSFSELMTHEYPPARYLLEPYFELGTLNMVSAPPNTWKSWLLLYFAAEISMGKIILDKFATEKSKVMIINEEDSPRSVQDRYKLLNVTDLSLDIYFHIMKGFKLELKTVEILKKELQEKDIKTVIFDSLRAIHNSNENDSQEMQKIMDFLKEFTRLGITVIFTHHHRKKSKGEKGDDAEASRGSSAVNAAVSGHISLEEENNENGLSIVVRHQKSKAGEKLEPINIKINKEANKVWFSFDGKHNDYKKNIQEAKENIISHLSQTDMWMTKKDFIELELAGRDTVSTALWELQQDNIIIGITRKEAQEQNLKVDSTGKSNEKLYSINHDVTANNLDTFTDELTKNI